MIQVTETLKYDPTGGGDSASVAVDKILAGGNAVVGSEDAISIVLARFGASSEHITRTLQRVRESS
jgi:hypothetical protein